MSQATEITAMHGVGDIIIQGHTIKIVNPIPVNNNKYLVKCLTCGWETMADTEAEANFDVRYHNLKQKLSPVDNNIDWDKLL